MFLEKKHNLNTTRKGFSIKMYMEGPSHEPYFIVLTLWEQIIIEPMKKLVTTYVVRDLVLQIISLSVDK